MDTDKLSSSPYEAHLKNQKGCFCQKGENAVKLQKVIFQTSQKLLASEHSIAIHSISKTGHVTTVLAIVHAKLRALEASSFCDFWKITSCDFTLFYSFFFNSSKCFFEMCLVRSTIIIIANLCPIMINFNAFDFYECCSEEIISFFWCSVL